MATITALKVFTISTKTGRILTTARGPRVYAIGFELSDGSRLVSLTRTGSQMDRASKAARVARHLEAGIISRDVSLWGSDELAMYERVAA